MKARNLGNLRASSRMALDIEAALFSSKETPLWGRVQDISIGGAFVETDSQPPAVATPVTLGVCMGEDDQVFSLTGTIWETPEQVRSASFHFFDPKVAWLTAPKYVNIS